MNFLEIIWYIIFPQIYVSVISRIYYMFSLRFNDPFLTILTFLVMLLFCALEFIIVTPIQSAWQEYKKRKENKSENLF